jgi:hypothetical protein
MAIAKGGTSCEGAGATWAGTRYFAVFDFAVFAVFVLNYQPTLSRFPRKS